MNDQPTPQHDDETALVHAVMNTLDGALHHDIDCRDVKAILDALKTLGYEHVLLDGIDYSVAEARYLAAALLAAAAKVEASE